MAVFHVNGPNGEVYEVTAPDGATEAQVVAFAQQQHGKPPAKPQGVADQVTGFMANVNRGLGIGDEMAAGARTVGNLFSGKVALSDVPGDFSASMAHQRQLESGYSDQHPHMAALARGTGMAATAAVPAGNTANVFAQGARIGNMARGATQAGLSAAAYGAVDAGTPSERLKAASSAATNPFVLGLGAVAGGMATPKMAKAQPLSQDALEAAKNTAYQSVDASGVQYKPTSFDDLVQSISKDATANNINPLRHPKAASMIGDLQAMSKAGTAPSLTELDQLRQVVRRDVATAPDRAEQFFGKRMIANIDDFIANTNPTQLTGGNADEAAGLIGQARDLNTRVRKVDAINSAVAKAETRAGSTGVGGNADNAIRQNLRRVMEKTPNFTDEEKQALESIVMGGKGQNLLRLVGRLSPNSNALMAGGNLVAASAGGPLGAIPGAAGLVSKLVADGMTRSKVAQLIAQISTVNPASTVAASTLTGPAAATLSRAAGVGGAVAGNPFARSAQPTSP